ncbi:hypothetical protein Tco_1283464 [Tanacetum coccineum]
MEDLLHLIESKLSLGFIRLVMDKSERLSFSILISPFNAYVIGAYDGHRPYEIGKRPASNMVGMQIERDALIRYAEEVQSHQGEPGKKA